MDELLSPCPRGILSADCALPPSGGDGRGGAWTGMVHFQQPRQGPKNLRGVFRCLYQPSSPSIASSEPSKGSMRPMPSSQSVRASLATLELVLSGEAVSAELALEASRDLTAFSAFVWRALYHLGEDGRRVVHSGS